MREEAPPTVRQIYAIAAAVCEQAGAEFPRDRGAASRLIRELRGGEDPGEQDPSSEAVVEGGTIAK